MGLRPEVCVGAIIVEHGQLLVVKRGRGAAIGQWSVPGGRVEPGETLADAVVREVQEETALTVTCGRFLGWVERIGEGHHFVIMDFLAHTAASRSADELVSGPASVAVAGDDAADVAWVGLHELDEVDLVDGLESFLIEHRVLDQHGPQG